jgi:hypothetical protein
VSTPAWDRAVADGDVAAIRQMLAAGADVDARDRHGQTALMRSAHRGDLAVVRTLLEAGAGLDVTAKYGLSAIMLAVVAGHADVARVLARAGSNLALAGTGAPGFAGKSAFDLAAARGDMEALLGDLRPAWHALLAPLPDGATVRRQRVAAAEILATPEGAAIAGWEQLTVELSAGAAGLRHVLVVLDATGRPISASDAILYRREFPGRSEVEIRQESVGGRLEADGTFRGTRWSAVGVETPDADEPQMESLPSTPGPDDVAALERLVADVLRRCPPSGP